MKFTERLRVLWEAFLFLFNKESLLWIGKEASVGFGPKGVTASMNVLNRDGGYPGKWEMWSCSFDGKNAVGYIDDKCVSPPPIDNSDLNHTLKLATQAADGTLSDDPILSSLQVAEDFYVKGQFPDLVEMLEHATDFAKGLVAKDAPVDVIVNGGEYGFTAEGDIVDAEHLRKQGIRCPADQFGFGQG